MDWARVYTAASAGASGKEGGGRGGLERRRDLGDGLSLSGVCGSIGIAGARAPARDGCWILT